MGMDAQRKAAAYQKKHAAGETDEAKSDLARLAEVRKRREEAKKKREEEEAAAAGDAEAAAKAEKEKAAKASAKVELPKPTQKEVKTALLRIQDAASDDFLNKWKLKGASGNKLA